MALRRLYLIRICFPVVLLFFACSPVKKVKDGEFLLTKNEIVEVDAKLLELKGDIDLDEIEAYIRQKPNRKVLRLRMHLGVYNSINEDRLKKKKTRRETRFARKDKRRQKRHNKYVARKIKKGKPYKPFSPMNRNRRTFREWVMDIGEAPVIYDSLLAHKSARQIRMYLQNKGFFNAVVRDSVVMKRKRAQVYYIIDHKKPYQVRKVSYEITDPLLAYYVYQDTANRQIIPGRNYDVDKITSERERITRHLKNNGYYYFVKEYIFFEIDSTLGSRSVDITILIKSREMPVTGQPDSIRVLDHLRYRIGNIFIHPDFNPKMKGMVPQDSSNYKGIFIVCHQTPKFHDRILADAVMFHSGEYYQSVLADATYQRFSELKSFKFINVSFREAGAGVLDAYIYLTPVVKQSFSIETEGTNTGGNLGISGSFIYQNRNVFKGAEVFEIKLKGGLEIQQSDPGNDENSAIVSNSFIPFNTLEFGPELNLHVPRFLSPVKFKMSRLANPHTTFTVSMNVQKRPSFSRTAVSGSLNYTWKENVFKRHTVYPVELNLISIDPYPEFEDYLNNSQDPFVVYRYSDHTILGGRYAFVYNNQTAGSRKGFWYFRGGAEAAGNLLRGVFNLVDQFVQELPTEEGGYLLNGSRFSQYLRCEADLRYYKSLTEMSKLVLRAFVGVGKPLHNLRELPFEKSFFAGGPNSIRGWKARTIGPGSYYRTGISTFDQVGDNQIELNFEYRFNLVKVVHAAFFTDAGNIWMRRDFEDRDGEDITVKRAYKELAIGSGFGLRLDFSFFVIRLDLGIKMHDPIFSEGDRWVVQHLFDKEWKTNWTPSTGVQETGKYPFYNFNFGIGYPF
ncbi:MAG: BamA/TamA family outer membrane protein [Bacteroidia bacterium]|nr:BamA/TamA family outer membrane protein [Bacteroidia bacterium]